MGTDDLFKKRRAERQKRKHEFKSVNTNSFLIVTEGEKTEPLYFKGLQKKINEKINGRIDIVENPVIDIFGQGCSTSRLIEATEEIVKDSKVFYQNIWVVFDKDDFKDFDEAIRLGKEKGYKIAWSNQSFEYWLYLHFNYADTIEKLRLGYVKCVEKKRRLLILKIIVHARYCGCMPEI